MLGVDTTADTLRCIVNKLKCLIQVAEKLVHAWAFGMH